MKSSERLGLGQRHGIGPVCEWRTESGERHGRDEHASVSMKASGSSHGPILM